MADDVGLPSSNPDEDLNAGVLLAGPFNIKLPNILNLTQERFISQGMIVYYLLLDVYVVIQIDIY